jgi:hypothetical protein
MGPLANSPAGASAERELVTLALDAANWTEDKALALGASPATAMRLLEQAALPAKQVEPGGVVDGQRGPRTDRLMQSLRTIGAKISPSMTSDQVDVWVAAMTVALSDLPFAFAMRGINEAIHVPMRYLNEVEGVIREKSEAAHSRHQVAMMRLAKLERERGCAANTPKLPPQPRMTQEQVDGLPDHLKRLGLAAGHLREENGRVVLVDDDDNEEK